MNVKGRLFRRESVGRRRENERMMGRVSMLEVYYMYA
jgi:hypothetical protein